MFPHFNDKKCGKGSEVQRDFCVNGVDFSMIKVDGGEFSMGDDGEQVKDNPAHKVMVSDFLIGQTEVTQALWEAVMGNNPSYSKGEELPVEQVSWEDCMLFVQKLNELTKEISVCLRKRNGNLQQEEAIKAEDTSIRVPII